MVDFWLMKLRPLISGLNQAQDAFCQLNKVVEGINKRVVSEVDTLMDRVNHRGEETKELDNVTKNLLLRFSAMEEHICILEEESVMKSAMVNSLSLEVDFLKEWVCCCEEEGSRPVLGSRTHKDPYKLEYASDSEYVQPLVVTALIPINTSIVCDPSLVLRFGDDEEEGPIVKETRELLASVADPQENKVPIPIRITLPPPQYQELVREGQRCVHSNGPLKKLSFHPYRCSDTFMGMPAGLRSTKDLHHNLKRLQ